jgi:hypothetical protein
MGPGRIFRSSGTVINGGNRPLEGVMGMRFSGNMLALLSIGPGCAKTDCKSESARRAYTLKKGVMIQAFPLSHH